MLFMVVEKFRNQDGKAVYRKLQNGRGLPDGLASFHAPAMEEPDRAHDAGGFKRQADEGMRPSAMMLEGGDGAAKGPENIEIGSFGGQRHGQGGVGCLAVEAGAGEHGSGHQMGERVHGLPAYRGRDEAMIWMLRQRPWGAVGTAEVIRRPLCCSN